MSIRFLLIFVAFFSKYASSSAVIDRTRVIYDEKKTDVTIMITNMGKSPILLQSWLDTGNESGEDTLEKKIPFVITPPITKIKAEKSQSLRMIYNGMLLPKNKESIFWLNILEIPSSNLTLTNNKLDIAFKSRIKVFYRPENLGMTYISAAEKMKFSIIDDKLKIHNETPYYITLASVMISSGSYEEKFPSDMISPFSTSVHNVKVKKIMKGSSVNYSVIDDWGAVRYLSAITQ